MAFRVKNTAERNPLVYEGATIFWRPVLFDQQRKIEHECTEMGVLDEAKKHLRIAQEAVVGWDAEVHDADDNPLAVPSGTDEDRRPQIALIVSTFPTVLIVQLGVLACADNPEVIKKSWETMLLAASSLSTDAPAENSPATTADANGPATA
jgi:hypothetical protein